MDINEKLDTILRNDEELRQMVETLQDTVEELQESIANLSLPGSGYSVFSPEE